MKKRQARILQWLSNIDNNRIKSRKERVLKYIMDHTTQNGQNGLNGVPFDKIRYELNIPHQTISSAITGLLDHGVVKCIDIVRVVDKHTWEERFYSVYAYVSDPIEQEIESDKRIIEKYETWLKKGLEFKKFMTSELAEKIELEQLY